MEEKNVFNDFSPASTTDEGKILARGAFSEAHVEKLHLVDMIIKFNHWRILQATIYLNANHYGIKM